MGDDYRMYWNLEIANHTLDALTDTIRASQRGTAHNKRRGGRSDDYVAARSVKSTEGTEVHRGTKGLDQSFLRATDTLLAIGRPAQSQRTVEMSVGRARVC